MPKLQKIVGKLIVCGRNILFYKLGMLWQGEVRTIYILFRGCLHGEISAGLGFHPGC